ncbi:ferredoxin--nitrite reductase [Herpetosiphon llansteffanensis]
MAVQIETIKKLKNGLDVLPDLYRYASLGFDAIPEDEIERLKWYGLLHRKQTPGFFMQRLRIPNGILSTRQMRAIVSISRDFGRNTMDLTTRENIQLRWLRIEDVPAVFQRLQNVGLTSQQTGLDNYRNVMGCPLAGLHHAEIFNAAPIAQSVSLALLGREFSDLPRKFNITISGCSHDCAHSRANDIGMTPAAKEINGYRVLGFHVALGGALGGTTPQLGQDAGIFLTTEQALPFCRAVLSVFRDNGSREKRTEARLKWLIREWGMPRFMAEVEKSFGQPFFSAGESLLAAHNGDHLGIHQQQDEGFVTVGLLVPVGRTNAQQMAEIADLADAYGTGELRLTPDQNILIPNVHETCLERLLAEPLLQVLQPHAPGALRGLVSCTGRDYCHFALSDTKELSLQVAEELSTLIPAERRVDLKVSGCVHACGQHHVGEIGLQAQRLRLEDGSIVDAFDLFVGGNHQQLATLKARKIPVDQLAERIAAELAILDGE